METKDQGGDDAEAGGEISQHQPFVALENPAERRVNGQTEESAAGVGEHEGHPDLRNNSRTARILGVTRWPCFFSRAINVNGHG